MPADVRRTADAAMSEGLTRIGERGLPEAMASLGMTIAPAVPSYCHNGRLHSGAPRLAPERRTDGWGIVARRSVRDPEEGWDEVEESWDNTVFATLAACEREITRLNRIILNPNLGDFVVHRGAWHIYASTAPVPNVNFEFHHKDYDGAPDSGDCRCGFAATLADALAQIDDLNAEAA